MGIVIIGVFLLRGIVGQKLEKAAMPSMRMLKGNIFIHFSIDFLTFFKIKGIKTCKKKSPNPENILKETTYFLYGVF